ncbi:hypothetical protein JOD47_003429 [Arthrobacter tumbae]|nr:hypothetical protein [Arthrobacter tumbae]
MRDTFHRAVRVIGLYAAGDIQGSSGSSRLPVVDRA